MKLSDSIALGRTLVVMDPRIYQTCLLGLGCVANGRDPCTAWTEKWPEWPWLKESSPIPAPFGIHMFRGAQFYDLISEIAREVHRGKLSMEQAIDYIRSIEPAEAPAAEPVVAEAEAGHEQKNCSIPALG